MGSQKNPNGRSRSKRIAEGRSMVKGLLFDAGSVRSERDREANWPMMIKI